jgi:vacuolar-type H+-ATPase subunit F/Vma7
VDAFFVIGDADTVLAFSLAGIRGCAVETPGEAESRIRAAAAEARGQSPPRATVLLVTAGIARHARGVLDRVTLAGGGPLVLEIPGVGEPAGESALDDLVHRLLGTSA